VLVPVPPALFDAHCHLDFAAFDADRDAVLARARAAGVRGVLIAGYDPAGWTRIAELACTHDDVFGAVGLHPWALATVCAREGVAVAWTRVETWMRGLDEVLGAAESRVVALGETGIDGTAAAAAAPRALQVEVLRAHVALARRRRLPLVLHAPRGLDATLRVLRETAPAADGRDAGGMVHAFPGSAEQVRECVAAGLYVSFGRAVCDARARRAHEALRAAPGERLLLETDAQSPGWEPADVGRVLDAAARIREEDPRALAHRTADNARALLRIDHGRDDRANVRA
jgi:TatD DNase family protein